MVGKRAWLITWVHVAQTDVSNDNRIAAIVSARRSQKFVENVAEIIFRQRRFLASEIVADLNKKSQLSVEGGYPGHIFVGYNPFLFGRIVENLTTSVNVENQTETLSWTEAAIYKNATVGSGIVQKRAPVEVSLTRSLKPLGSDSL